MAQEEGATCQIPAAESTTVACTCFFQGAVLAILGDQTCPKIIKCHAYGGQLLHFYPPTAMNKDKFSLHADRLKLRASF